MASRIDVSGAQQYIKSQGVKLKQDFQKEIINRSRALAQKMQADMNKSVDRGAVTFTQRSILFLYKKSGTGVTTSILVKDLQAKYLYDIIVKEKAIDKIVPTSAARLSAQGNIAGLKKNLASGRYKIVKGKNGKQRLIDTTKKDTKTKTKRVIGLRETKRRKIIYDFYQGANDGVRLMISGIQGSFIIKRN
jgi:hypothetical protein